MCTNLTPLCDESSVTGYKIVAEKDGKLYSLAMGTRYYDGKKVKAVKRQRRITPYFNRHLLDPEAGRGFVDEMIGRTSAFCDCRSARHIASRMWFGTSEERWLYEIAIYEVRLSEGLMRGEYGKHQVVVGRRIHFLTKVCSYENLFSVMEAK